jgi:endoglucanase
MFPIEESGILSTESTYERTRIEPMTDDARSFLIELLNTPSPSGFEADGQRTWATYARPYADAVESDSYGNTWAILRADTEADAPRLMLEAHADEIGFMVNYITDKGFLHIYRIGGSDPAVMRGRRVSILGDKGVVNGVIGHTAIHLRDRKDEKVPSVEDMFIDIGASSADDVAERGIRVGHPAVFAEGVVEWMPGRLIGRALDNRIGGFIIAQVLARLAAEEHRPSATVLAVNSVQEEIGGHGAKMVTYRLQPSLAVVLDVTHATDFPGINKAQHGKVVLGGGPTVTHGSANHPKVIARLMEVADVEGIALQHEASSRSTGTDTDDVYISRSGVPSALVSLPMRYMHTPIEMIDLDDVEQVIALLVAFARSIRPDDAFRADV